MIRIRLAIYVLYIVLGAVIITRVLAIGLHWESAAGLILGAAMIGLGVHKLLVYMRFRVPGPP